ncbi:hypothetical protein DL93DRAFT_2132412 [Clavulina sp. PMI_390]|nr:hypothetical protein DL93DRAFT_2132412 [Clavulina sp. PMI_390]
MDWAELDLSPPYPTPASLSQQFASKVLSIDQRKSLVNHSLSRACLFADLTLLSFLLTNPISKPLLDLSAKDEDGLSIISQSILGFGDDSDRTVDREECIRLLISNGVSVDEPDLLGWTPLHHAALRAPATLIVYLLSHGASSLAQTHKSFTPLDLITAYQSVPDREDIALILQESMREHGWDGSALEQRRKQRQRQIERSRATNAKRVDEWSKIGQVLGAGPKWWGRAADIMADEPLDSVYDHEYDNSEDLPDEMVAEEFLSPPEDYLSMLVFAPSSIPEIVQRVIVDAPSTLFPITSRSAPANTLYYLARFASIHCDDSWLDELLTSALDCIEESTYARPDGREDLPHTTFWLYNTTLLLHLLRCDHALFDICESMDLFFLLEELIRSLYAFILRCTEKRIQPLIVPALLDHSPLTTEFESVQFESDWSFFRSLTPKRKNLSASSISVFANASVEALSATSRDRSSTIVNGSRNIPGRPSSPSAGAKALSSIRQTISRNGQTPLANVFSPPAEPSSSEPSPTSITAILSALHSLLRLYSINPSITIQAFSQIYYWVACETFNKMIVQKKYLCRSRAMQIGMNISVMEEWITNAGLPASASTHFQTLRELLIWLQCHSSISQFTSLIDTIQTMKSLNPVQMRRAVRDYRYEVSEPRMDEECLQYLGQLQKDWERKRVRMGVEALQREHAEKNRDRAESVVSSGVSSTIPTSDETQLSDKEIAIQQANVDRLFDREHLKNEWVAPSGPTVLGELMDTSFPLRLLLPSDPELLAAWPGPDVDAQLVREEKERRRASQVDLSSMAASRASIGNRGAMEWRLRSRTVRNVASQMIHTLDGGVRASKPDLGPGGQPASTVATPTAFDDDGGDGAHDEEGPTGEDTQILMRPLEYDDAPSLDTHLSAFTKRPKRHSRLPRESSGAETITPESFREDLDYDDMASVPERESSKTPEPIVKSYAPRKSGLSVDSTPRVME